jgi:hypothetical protein
MQRQITAADLDADTPTDVDVRATAREPQWDPTVGIPVQPSAGGAGGAGLAGGAGGAGEPPHRLVTIGDSLTHGFQSNAVFHTDLSYPAIIAWELGCFDQFRFPRYDGHGGLPLNLEMLLRDLEDRFGDTLDLWEIPSAIFRVHRIMDEIEDYWERGPGAAIPSTPMINHNLAVYGWDLRDALSKTADGCRAMIRQPKDNIGPLRQGVQHDTDRAALRVYPTATGLSSMTVFDAASALGAECAGDACGIETLIVALGANNALGSVAELKVRWSGDGYDDPAAKGAFTVWRPTHFAAELRQVAAQVHTVNARHVIWCTVPHVTIAPIARGVGSKIHPSSRYFPHYSRPWVTDDTFNPNKHRYLTSAQARAIDSAIDQYNDEIVSVVADARHLGKDWLVFDLAGTLDRLAQRRYLEHPEARPDWWRPYQLPEELLGLDPVPDARFLLGEGGRRTAGGLFSVDGVHPTTVGYGLVAQELITVMRGAGVRFRHANGAERTGDVRVDFARLLRRDALVARPPAYLRQGLTALGWLDELGLF